jgi:hypothetical protein
MDHFKDTYNYSSINSLIESDMPRLSKVLALMDIYMAKKCTWPQYVDCCIKLYKSFYKNAKRYDKKVFERDVNAFESIRANGYIKPHEADKAELDKVEIPF